nr:aurora kinase A and ninein-interacting protein isoform X2 [Monopterus albus]
MKTSKSAMQTCSQGECGIWLDTVQLKRKAKQKRLARPISKLLNPFAEGAGYSLAVALNFTQTNMEMPKTKQTSISTFFTPQHRILNKMSASEIPKMDPVQSSPSSISTASTTLASRTKQECAGDLEKSDLYNSQSDVDHEWKSVNVTESEAAVWQEQDEASQMPSQSMYCESEKEPSEEFSPPQSKKQSTDDSYLPGNSQCLLQAWSQDPLFTLSQYSDSEFYLTKQKNTPVKKFSSAEQSFLNDLQCDKAFGFPMDLEERTSTQKLFKHFHSSQMDDEKENRSLSANSPSKHSSFSHPGSLSNHKWTEWKTASPRKHITEQLWREADKEESYNSQFKWTNPRSTPLKKQAPQQQSRAVDEDSLAMLFTQDSEGLKVIAHRSLQTRSPLNDQSNISTGTVRTTAYKSLVEDDEEDEMVFTQDTQGNMVIKN